MSAVRKEVLPNGLTILTESMPVELRHEPSSAVHSDPGGGEPGRGATLSVSLLIAAAAVAAGVVYLSAPVGGHWPTFAALAAAATIAQAFPVNTPGNVRYHTSVVFLVAAALLLPPQMLVLIALVQTIPEWLMERYAWSTEGFHVANYTLDALAAWAVATARPVDSQISWIAPAWWRRRSSSATYARSARARGGTSTARTASAAWQQARAWAKAESPLQRSASSTTSSTLRPSAIFSMARYL